MTGTTWPHLDEVSIEVKFTGTGNEQNGGFKGLREEGMRKLLFSGFRFCHTQFKF